VRFVSIENIGADETLRIVKDLRDQGYVQGVDFDFAYRPEIYDNFCGEPLQIKHAEFTFYVEKYATLFALKYCKND
jgi:hypothetical protein